MFWSPAVATFSVVSARARPGSTAESAVASSNILRCIASSPIGLLVVAGLGRPLCDVSAKRPLENSPGLRQPLGWIQVQRRCRDGHADLGILAEMRCVVDLESLSQ